MAKDYKKISDDDLEKFVSDDNPDALYEKGRRLLLKHEVAAARRFLTFASVLGNKDAHIELARICEEEDNFEEAYELYALAYAKGADSVLPQLARLLMRTDPKLALEVLKTNALEGNTQCLKELITVYEQENNKKELKFWQAKLAEFEQAPEKSAKDQ